MTTTTRSYARSPASLPRQPLNRVRAPITRAVLYYAGAQRPHSDCLLCALTRCADVVIATEANEAQHRQQLREECWRIVGWLESDTAIEALHHHVKRVRLRIVTAEHCHYVAEFLAVVGCPLDDRAIVQTGW
jgi:hypothetical protein